MEQTILFAPSQEVPASELIALQDNVRAAFDATIADLLIRSVAYKGLSVTRVSSSELAVGKGRLYVAGRAYGHDAAQTISVTPHLPAGSYVRRIAVVATGTVADTDAEPRKFLVDPATRTVRSRTVATRNARAVAISIIEGVEAVAPIDPVVPANVALLALVTLTATGIAVGAVDPVTDQRAPNLEDTVSALTLAQASLAVHLGLIHTLRSDLAGLARQVKGTARASDLYRLQWEVAGVREDVGMPDTYTMVGLDIFKNADESDEANAAYDCDIEGGEVTFAHTAATTAPLALLSPSDSRVMVGANGVCLPAYDEVIRLENAVAAEGLVLSNYPVVTRLTKTGAPAYVFKWSKKKWGSLAAAIKGGKGKVQVVDPVTAQKVTVDLSKHAWQVVRLTSWGALIAIDEADPYWDTNAEAVGYSGVKLGQTFLNAQSGWLTSVGINIKSLGASGDIRVFVCRVGADGTPDMSKVLANSVAAHATLKTGWNKIDVGPVHTARGERYAIVTSTTGAHVVWSSTTNEITNGGLFFSSDSDYWDGSLSRDLDVRLYYAQFRKTHLVVEMTAASLAGGIAGLDLTFSGVVPSATDWDLQAQVAGKWRQISADDETVFSTAPDLVPLRAVWQSTKDDAVGVVLAASRVVTYRPRFTAVHISKARTLPEGVTTTSIWVREILSGYDATHNTHQIKLLTGAGYATEQAATSVTVETLDDGSVAFRARFTLGSPVSTYKIKSMMATDTADRLYGIGRRNDRAI